jgi:molybdate transport system substrate-binding protein
MKAITFVFTLLLLVMGNNILAQQKIIVAAASDLKFAMDSIIDVYQKQAPDNKIYVTYGSSGKFFEQIQYNAPFDIYFSADIDYPKKLKDKGLTLSVVKTYGIGRIVVWSKIIDPNIKGMGSFLDPEIKKIAIANPTHAPYGARAKESLDYFEIYDKVKNKLVYGENISQTTQFVTTGAADIGIVALSLALSPNVKKEGGKYFVIPENTHVQLEQGYVILKHAQGKELATNFYDFIASSTAVKILTHFGFKQKTI